MTGRGLIDILQKVFAFDGHFFISFVKLFVESFLYLEIPILLHMQTSKFI
jgi:hypothetical protein